MNYNIDHLIYVHRFLILDFALFNLGVVDLTANLFFDNNSLNPAPKELILLPLATFHCKLFKNSFLGVAKASIC